jgi:hypothetical protein
MTAVILHAYLVRWELSMLSPDVAAVDDELD